MNFNKTTGRAKHRLSGKNPMPTKVKLAIERAANRPKNKKPAGEMFGSIGELMDKQKKKTRR